VADEKSLANLMQKGGLGTDLTSTEWKTLRQKLNNLDALATDILSYEKAGNRRYAGYGVFVDWSNDGDYTTLAIDDISSRFISADIMRGLPGPLSYIAIPAQIEIVLDNSDDYFSIDNTDSAIIAYTTGSAKKRCKMTMTCNGTEYQLFDGWVKEIACAPLTHGKKLATIVVDDVIGRLKSIPFVGALGQTIEETAALEQALASAIPTYYDACYYDACYYDYAGIVTDMSTSFGPSLDSFSYLGDLWKESTTSVLDVLGDVTRSVLGFFYVSRTGVLTWHNRQYRSINASSTDWAAAYLASRIDAVGLQDETVYNEVIVKIRQPVEDTDGTQVVWTLRSSPDIGANSSTTFPVEYTDPSTGAPCGVVDGVTPVRGTDFTNNTNLTGTVLWRGADALYTIANSSGSAIGLTLCQLRATPVTRYDESLVRAGGTTNPRKTFWFYAPCLTNLASAQAYATALHSTLSVQSTSAGQATIIPSSETEMEFAAQIDVDFRIDCVDGLTSYVNWVHHEIRPGMHRVVVGLSPALSVTQFTLGTSAFGEDTFLGV